MRLKTVVLPAPFGPIRPTISPSPTSSETSSTATIPPNRRVTPSIESSGMAYFKQALDQNDDRGALGALGSAPDPGGRRDRVLPASGRDGVLDAARCRDVAVAGRERRLQRVRDRVVPLDDVA